MKYERLTKRNARGDIETNCEAFGCPYYKNGEMNCWIYGEREFFCQGIMVDRLAELEDKIERGELVENNVITHVNMARSGSKTLITKALAYDELKAKIEQGTMIELPCKVGDTVYVIYQYDDFMGTTEEPFIEKDTVSFFVYDDNKMKIVPSNYAERSDYWYTTIDILLTREEAEKRLKELQDG